MNCPKCGKPLAENTNYCQYCSEPIENSSQEAVDTTAPIMVSSENTVPPVKKRGPKLAVFVSLLIILSILISIPLFTPKYAPNLVSTNSWKYAMCSTVTVSELKDSWNDYVRNDLSDSFEDVKKLLSMPGMGWVLDEDNLYAVITDQGSPNIEKAIYTVLQNSATITLFYEKDTQRVVGIEIRYSQDYMNENTAQNNRSILVERPCKLASIFSGLSEELLLKEFDNALDSGKPIFYTKGIACGAWMDDYFNEAVTQIHCSANNPFSE